MKILKDQLAHITTLIRGPITGLLELVQLRVQGCFTGQDHVIINDLILRNLITIFQWLSMIEYFHGCDLKLTLQIKDIIFTEQFPVCAGNRRHLFMILIKIQLSLTIFGQYCHFMSHQNRSKFFVCLVLLTNIPFHSTYASGDKFYWVRAYRNYKTVLH